MINISYNKNKNIRYIAESFIKTNIMELFIRFNHHFYSTWRKRLFLGFKIKDFFVLAIVLLFLFQLNDI